MTDLLIFSCAPVQQGLTSVIGLSGANMYHATCANLLKCTPLLHSFWKRIFDIFLFPLGMFDGVDDPLHTGDWRACAEVQQAWTWKTFLPRLLSVKSTTLCHSHMLWSLLVTSCNLWKLLRSAFGFNNVWLKPPHRPIFKFEICATEWVQGGSTNHIYQYIKS